ncbi:hypothetical protein IM697_14040 [Streptomyces ferrugineus]|uniref:Uncharacterized protein n=1 Tax=Streptomyces ferrugineus TaxID=1413221 RepID=A0A7M2SSS0_9ACTN|nr:hypothetical protein [Streptomyces ferrugineus]QOV39407.1 hypothetical protein IM697_14040 [Streptomyces ferrugineus]
MLSANRRLVGLAMASAVVLGGAAAVPAAAEGGAAEARARYCRISVDNAYIYKRWSELGGSDGFLGCPRTGTKNVTVNGVWKGQRQYFENGNITRSYYQGRRMVIAAWERDGHAFFNWGTTSPRFYDTFVVRYTSPAETQGRLRQVGRGTSGGMWVKKRTTGDYTFRVKGCYRTAQGLRCPQGWTLTATTRN